MLAKLRPGPTLLDRAYEAILGAIREGRLAPGERLNQDELAARLQISRQPVAQALAILKSQGFVRDNGRRGLVIASVDPEMLRAIYQMREALDPLAARLAAERCTDLEAVEGRRLIAKAAKASPQQALFDAELQLQIWIYRVAKNPLILETMDLYWTHLQRAVRQLPRADEPWEEHAKVALAVIAREPALAEARALEQVRAAATRTVAAAAKPPPPKQRSA